MQLDAARALLLALLLTLINGPALAGEGKVSGGGLARTIECNQNMAHKLELDERLRRASETPPAQRRARWSPRFLWS